MNDAWSRNELSPNTIEIDVAHLEEDNEDDPYTVIAPGAFADSVGKTVPLRLGIGGPVVGTATITDGKSDQDV